MINFPKIRRLFLGAILLLPLTSIAADKTFSGEDVLLENAQAEGSEVKVGIDAATQGTVIRWWKSEKPLAKGIISIDALELGETTTDVVIEASRNGFEYTEYLFGLPTKSQTAMRFVLPASFKGAQDVYLRIRATKTGSGSAAATLKGLRLEALESDELATDAQAPWRVSDIDPWIETDAAALPGQVTALQMSKFLQLIGPKNDWLTGALLISVPRALRFQVELETPDALNGKLEMRVVGQVSNTMGGVSWDPIYAADELEYGKELFNYSYIKDFPNVLADRPMPVFLWFTADLRGVDSGKYQANLHIRTEDGAYQETVPIYITVMKQELPEANPLYVITWNSWGKEGMPDMIEHGINVAWRQHEEAWKSGARFLLFQLGCTFPEGKFDAGKRDTIAAELDQIRALVKKLGVPKEQWAVNIQDEVNDNTAETVGKYAKIVKELRPDVPIWQNPLFGGSADATKAGYTATVDGTIKKIEATTDIYCPYSYHLGGPVGDYIMKTGKRLWYYDIWGTAGRRASGGREVWRIMPYRAWKYGAEGVGNYALNDNSGNLFRNTAAQGTIVYPGMRRAVSSRPYEALREGIQEYKLLKLLQEKGVGKELLDSWVALVLGARSPEVITTVRLQMIEKLKSLTEEN